MSTWVCSCSEKRTSPDPLCDACQYDADTYWAGFTDHWVCSCSAKRTSPDPFCDACDADQNDADTGWGGFTDHYLGKHFNSDAERDEYLKYDQSENEYGDETTGWGS